MPDPRVVFAVPGDPDAPTGGYAYDRRVATELRASGWSIDWLRLPDDFPFPSPRSLADAYAALAARDDDEVLLVDGLALGAMPEIGRGIGARRALVALVHHPLALETGLDAARVARLREDERAALRAARRVVVTSRTTASSLEADYDVAASRIVVAVPGVDAVDGSDRADRVDAERVRVPADRAREPHLLSVGTLVPRKGHDVLIAALRRLAARRWRLTVVGDDRRSPDTARALRDAVTRGGLADRVAFTGAVTDARLDALYADADAFVLASRHEGWGMAYAEAIARGLPVIGTTAGAIAESVPAAAAILVPPDDVDALAGAIATLLDDASRRATLARAAREAATRQPRWAQTAARVADALREAA